MNLFDRLESDLRRMTGDPNLRVELTFEDVLAVDVPDQTWKVEHPETWLGVIVYEARETGRLNALRAAWARLVCRLTRHDWHRRVYYESWDVGVGYEEEWWECSRCEQFTQDDPDA